MNDNQFYPTGFSLAKHVYRKFKNKQITRLLEPQAGRGDLLAPLLGDTSSWNRAHLLSLIDCCEIDFENQAILKAKGLRIVGHDFLSFRGAARYSHMLLNPPFNSGVQHVLHAWELLQNGELIAILNAETIRNPHTQERQLLLNLLTEHSVSEVEYLTEAFTTVDTKRKTTVEIAVIHLAKQVDLKNEFLSSLKLDTAPVDGEQGPANEVMLPNSQIQNAVLVFNTAVEALRQLEFARVRSNYYMGLLGRSLLDETTGEPGDVAIKFNEGYERAKECAWTSILRSTSVLDRVSNEARKRLEGEFKSICDLEFTVANIYGFLDGLISQQGEIQMGMICDVFDSIYKYHSKNRNYCQGWKSNDKHRDNAFQIKSTRFILPRFRHDRTGFEWNCEQQLRDMDKVFALLDGKHVDSTNGIVPMSHANISLLVRGERCTSDYFDIRYYPGMGTIHFFPRRTDLVDRLNRLVGRHRNWLPQREESASPAFWSQYDNADKISAKMPAIDNGRGDEWALHNGDEVSNRFANERLSIAHQQGCLAAGVKFDPNKSVCYAEAVLVGQPLICDRMAS